MRFGDSRVALIRIPHETTLNPPPYVAIQGEIWRFENMTVSSHVYKTGNFQKLTKDFFSSADIRNMKARPDPTGFCWLA